MWPFTRSSPKPAGSTVRGLFAHRPPAATFVGEIAASLRDSPHSWYLSDPGDIFHRSVKIVVIPPTDGDPVFLQFVADGSPRYNLSNDERSQLTAAVSRWLAWHLNSQESPLLQFVKAEITTARAADDPQPADEPPDDQQHVAPAEPAPPTA